MVSNKSDYGGKKCKGGKAAFFQMSLKGDKEVV